jgi:hypothetical protein
MTLRLPSFEIHAITAQVVKAGFKLPVSTIMTRPCRRMELGHFFETQTT